MKRMISLMLAALLFCAPSVAMAENGLDDALIPPDTAMTLDLDGDGALETVSWTSEPVDEYATRLVLTVSGEDGLNARFETDFESSEAVCAADLNGDGVVELFLTGDEASDDYATVCLHLREGELMETLFADTCRGTNTNGYYKYGYGQLEAMDPEAGTVTLSGSQDVLGTWFGSRTLRLEKNGLFEFADNGWWIRDIDLTDDDLWEYGALTTIQEVECELDGAYGRLPAGSKLIVTGSDKEGLVSFALQDGRQGILEIAPDYERGWGCVINGIPEDQLFEYVPYAD